MATLNIYEVPPESMTEQEYATYVTSLPIDFAGARNVEVQFPIGQIAIEGTIPGMTPLSTIQRPDTPPVSIVPVSPWQMRKALNSLGMRNTIEAAVAASTDQNVKDGWEFATEFRRDDPLIASMAAALSLSDAEVDAVFILAGTM